MRARQRRPRPTRRLIRRSPLPRPPRRADNLPLDAFPGKKMLAFDLTSNADISHAELAEIGRGSNLPEGMFSHFGALINILVNNANEKKKSDRKAAVRKLNHKAKHPTITQRATCWRCPNMIDVVPILTGTAATLNTKLDAQTIDAMVAVGYIAVDKYLGKATLHRKAQARHAVVQVSARPYQSRAGRIGGGMGTV